MSTEKERADRAASIVRWLRVDDSWLLRGSAVSLFGGIQTEPDLWPLAEWLLSRNAVVVFYDMEDESLVPRRVRAREDLAAGPLGVWVPLRERTEEIALGDLGSVLVPGLAFGRNDGSRLGRGKGYYDRLIGSLSPSARVIGVGFDFQFVSHIPCEAHDARMHALVSEVGWIEVD